MTSSRIVLHSVIYTLYQAALQFGVAVLILSRPKPPALGTCEREGLPLGAGFHEGLAVTPDPALRFLIQANSHGFVAPGRSGSLLDSASFQNQRGLQLI